MPWKTPTNPQELIGRKVTVLEEIPTAVGIYKKLWRGVVGDFNFLGSMEMTYFSLLNIAPCVKTTEDETWVSSTAFVIRNQHNKARAGRTVPRRFPFYYASIERIDNKSLYSIYGYNIEHWPPIALQVFFTRRLRNRVLQCKGNFLDVRQSWFVNTLYAIKYVRNIRKSEYLDTLERYEQSKKNKELRKLFDL